MNTPKPWDDSMKWLVRQNPQSLVSFLVPDAVFDGEVDRELQAPAVTADTLYQEISSKKNRHGPPSWADLCLFSKRFFRH